MATAAQIEANKQNAQASTGPATKEGKQRSSQNSIKHGLTAKGVLIPGESQEEYEQFALGLMDYWSPINQGERAHVEELINIQWRLRRAEKAEGKIFCTAIPDFKALNNISLHAARLKRLYSATFKELTLMQQSRVNRAKRDMEEAEIIRRADLATGRQTNLKEFGFDFDIELVDEQIRRHDKLAAALRTLKTAGFSQPNGRAA
jgi:hypothetical protein